MENARAFIDEGGNAAWQYLIFPWNAHQVDEAKELSVEMGFKQFIARHDRSIATSLGLEKIQKRKYIDYAPYNNSLNFIMFANKIYYWH